MADLQHNQNLPSDKFHHHSDHHKLSSHHHQGSLDKISGPHHGHSPPKGGGGGPPPPGVPVFTARKLIVDPALVKGALKVYRYDGVIPGDPTSFHSIILRDPRKQSRNTDRRTPSVKLPVPEFIIDKNYVGRIPPTEVTATNLNDNVSDTFLRQLCVKFGEVLSVEILVHPISHRHLGLGHVCFKKSFEAKMCVQKLDGLLVMGKKVTAFHDTGGKKIRELFLELTTQKPKAATTSSSSIREDGRKGHSHTGSTSNDAPGQTPSVRPSSASTTNREPRDSSSHSVHDRYHYNKNEEEGVCQTPMSDATSGTSSSRHSEDRKASSSSHRGFNSKRDGYRHARDDPQHKSHNYGYPGPANFTPSSGVSSMSSHSSYHHHSYLPPPTSSSAQHSSLSTSQIQNTLTVKSATVTSESVQQQQHLVASNSSCTVVSSSETVSEEWELSPKIDLDTRIRLMLQDGSAGELGRLFADENIAPNSSEGNSAFPLKRSRLNFGNVSSKIWDSDSDEDVTLPNKEASFAKKFKQSFVPLDGGGGAASSRGHHGSSQQHNSLSPPPSPFLSFAGGSGSKNVKGKADPEFDQISDDENVGGNAGDDKDDMSLSSLSPDDAAGSRIRQSRFSTAPPPPPPPPPGQPPSGYGYGDYYSSSSYSASYQMQPWGSHHHKKEEHHYHHQTGGYPPAGYEQHQHGYTASYEHHHHQRQYHPGGMYPPPSSTHPYSDKPEDQRMMIPPKPPSPPPVEDHQNPELLIKALIEVMVEDLKKVLRRDCNKRLIESEAFKMYEEWWDKEAREFKKKQDEESAKNQQATSTVPAPAEVIINDDQHAVVMPARAAVAAALGGSGLGVGLGLLNAIPKLPSFRRNIQAPQPVQDEDSRKSFLDSDSDSLGGSDDDEIVVRKTKPRFLSSTDDDSDDDSSGLSKSSEKEEEPRDVTDAEVISTTEDEDEFGRDDAKPTFLNEEEEDFNKLPPTPGRMDVEDILSDDDLPEESARTPTPEEKEEEDGSLGICATTGRLYFKPGHSSAEQQTSEVEKKLLEDTLAAEKAKLAEQAAIKKEVEDTDIEEKIAAAIQRESVIKIEPKSDLLPGLLGDYQNPFLMDADKPLILPYEAVRPRGKKASKAFRPRLEHERLDLVYEFLKEGIDAEDIRYFQKAYENLLFDDTLYWLNCTHWVDHTVTAFKTKKKPPKSKSKNKNSFDSEEGSLRTRGFVRMTKEEKSRAMAGRKPELPVSFDGLTLPSDKGTADLGKARETQIREARSNQRRLLTVLGTESDLLKFNQLHFRKKALRFARSGIHDWGLFAAEPIAADEMVIEYVGQMIRPVIADLRETKYEAQGIGSSYLFKIDPETIIDATRCGNLSRFINHSCNPNCYAKVITIEGKKKMVIYSKQPIAVSEEITYDYKFPIEDKKIPCLCGTPQCRGTLN